jgi:hypothetical protein
MGTCEVCGNEYGMAFDGPTPRDVGVIGGSSLHHLVRPQQE